MEQNQGEDLAGVIRAVAVRGFVDSKSVATAVGISARDTKRILSQHSDAGRIVFRSGRVSGWTLTGEGREWLRDYLGAYRKQHYAAFASIEREYESFIELNEPMKALCTRWQLEAQPAHCVDELERLHERVIPILEALSSASIWYASYSDRFTSALGRLKMGDTDAFTRPLADSYHDVWMQLHFDLLLALGRSRTDADGA